MTPRADGGLKAVFASIGRPKSRQFKPDAYQLKSVETVDHSDCLVTAPTGAGKTWIAEQAIRRIFNRGGKSWYATPLKALSNAKHAEFSALFGSGNVGILTGDRKENPEAPIIIGTTEILRNHLYDAMHQGVTMETDFVVLDEAHFLGDEDRGVVWEEVMIYLPSRIPMLMLSATVGNAEQIAGWLTSIRGKKCQVVEETKRPVPLFPLFLHPSGMLYPLQSKSGKSGKRKIHKRVASFLKSKSPRDNFSSPGLPPFGDILKVLKKFRLLPAIFFLKSRADCDNSLNLCTATLAPDSDRATALRRRIRELVKNSPHVAKHRQIRHLETKAIGAHHAGQLPAWKLVLETLMSEGLLDAIFATSTVAAGVNFPARSIVVLNSDRFNGREFLPLSPTEFHQMTGRAGRRGKDRIGFAIAIPGRFMDIRLISRLITAPPSPVVSQIRVNFSMVLNLLLSHTPAQVEDLLSRSFAAFMMQSTRSKRSGRFRSGYDPQFLDQDFRRHLTFLIHNNYVHKDGTLTEDGLWASRLRVDHPLLIAESFRLGLFEGCEPPMLAAIFAAFVYDRETDDTMDRRLIPKDLVRLFLATKRALRPFSKYLQAEGFESKTLYLRPAVAVHAWASGKTWQEVVWLSTFEEGNLASLILRTADNLRHVRALTGAFPDIADIAAMAIDRLLRDPVTMDFSAQMSNVTPDN